MLLDEDDGGKIAFLGPASSYSHQATIQYFGPKHNQFVAERTIADVFVAVETGRTRYGVVPFENSSNGPVDTTLDCLIDRTNQTTEVKAFAETYIKINHCLVGRTAPTPLSNGDLDHSATNTADEAAQIVTTENVKHVTDVYSHPQALQQCRAFLQNHLKTAELHEVASTSEAAAIVARLQVPTAAAISSHLAGEMYELDILASGIQNTKDNATRFLILTKCFPDLPPVPSGKEDSHKVLLAISVDHDAPGALADALHVFKIHDLNLTSINSRPSRTRAWYYLFLIELICSGTSEAVKSELESAFSDLQEKTKTFKSLGYWKVDKI